MLKAHPFEELLNTREAARTLGIRPRTLEHWRSIGAGPPYSRIGRAVRYRRTALERFISDNEIVSASAALDDFSRTANALGRGANPRTPY